MLKVENRSPINTLESFTCEAITRAPIFYSFASRFGDSYKREINHFIEVLDGKAQLLVTPQTNLAVSKIATAVEEAARTGKVVELSWTKDEQIE